MKKLKLLIFLFCFLLAIWGTLEDIGISNVAPSPILLVLTVIIITVVLIIGGVSFILGGMETPEFKRGLVIDFDKPVNKIWARTGLLFSKYYMGRNLIAWIGGKGNDLVLSNGKQFRFPCRHDPLRQKDYIDYAPVLELGCDEVATGKNSSAKYTERMIVVGGRNYKAKYFKLGKVVLKNSRTGKEVGKVRDLLLWGKARFDPPLPLLHALLVYEMVMSNYPPN